MAGEPKEGKARRSRWKDADKDLRCDLCGYPIDDCQCACPYCGETEACECTIGPDAATGG